MNSQSVCSPVATLGRGGAPRSAIPPLTFESQQAVFFSRAVLSLYTWNAAGVYSGGHAGTGRTFSSQTGARAEGLKPNNGSYNQHQRSCRISPEEWRQSVCFVHFFFFCPLRPHGRHPSHTVMCEDRDVLLALSSFIWLLWSTASDNCLRRSPGPPSALRGQTGIPNVGR